MSSWRPWGRVSGGLGDEGRGEALLDRLPGDHALADVAARRQLELDVLERVLDDRAQAAGASLALDRLVGDRLQRVRCEDELDVVEVEEALVLLGQRVAGLGQDRDQVLALELADRGDDTQPNAQMSLRLSTALPRACSGLM